jgi:hypothetical protein
MPDSVPNMIPTREMWAELSANARDAWMMTWFRLAMRDRSLPILRGYARGLQDLGATTAELSSAYERARQEAWPDAPSLADLERRQPASLP